MPYVRGGSLRDLLRSKGRLGVAAAAPIVAGIARALEYAHGERILHCDVKPENVLLHEEHPFVMDFGIARKLHAEAAEWRGLRQELDFSAGTPAYVSPEQAAGEETLDGRSDVYSLACVTWELLAGRPPFSGTTTREVVSRRFRAPPPDLRAFAPDLPAALVGAVERGMALAPAQRPATPLGFAHEVAAARLGPAGRLASARRAMGTALRRATHRIGLTDRWRQAAWMSDWDKDLRHAWRGLRRSPAFTVVAILTLGLALGANATMFGIVDRLLLRAPSGIVAPDRVYRVMVSRWFDGLRPASPSMSYPAFTDFRDRSRSFTEVAAWDDPVLTLGSGTGAVRVRTVIATGRYFTLLGVRPFRGRFFGEEDDRLPNGEAVVVLGHGFWRSHFGGDAAVVGTTVQLAGRPFEIIGVAPRGFTGSERRPVDLWIPFSAGAPPMFLQMGFVGFNQVNWTTDRGWQFLQTIVRLKDEVSAAAASADARQAWTLGHAEIRGEGDRRAVASLDPITNLADTGAKRDARVSVWLLGVTGVVLLIACANVANLVLARGLARRGELAIRQALGVRRGRLVRLLLSESLLLAAMGAVLGLVVARWGGRLVRAVLLPGVSWEESPMDHRVLMVTAAATMLTALVAGLMPLLHASRIDLAAALHGGSRVTPSHSRRLRAALVLAQSGLCTLLLVGAGLFVRSLRNTQALDLGIEPDRMIRVLIDVSGTGIGALGPSGRPDAAAATRFHREAAARLRRLPGVQAAGVSIGGPFMSNYAERVRVPGQDSTPRLPGGGPYYFQVSAGGLEAWGVSLRRGRLFTAADDQPHAAPTVIVTERMARLLWPGRDPIGECLIVGRGDAAGCREVIGIVADLHRQGLDEQAFLLFFTPLALADSTKMAEVVDVRVRGDPEAMVEPIRRELFALRQDLAYASVQPMADRLAPLARSWRLGATMFTVFGGLSLVIAAIGLYGVLSYAVTQRAAELGIRAALGATPVALLGLVWRGGVFAAGTGIGLGLAAALVAGRWMAPLLFRTSPRDPLVFLTAAATVLVIAQVASLAPGLRATRADPLAALRSE